MIVVGIVGVLSRTEKEEISNNQHIGKCGGTFHGTLQDGLVSMTYQWDGNRFDLVRRRILFGMRFGEKLQGPVYAVMLVEAGV